MLSELFLIALIGLILSQFHYFTYGQLSNSSIVNTPTIIDPSLKVEVIFRGIKFPTTMSFLGPDDILVLEKNEGTVKRIVNGTVEKEPILDVNVANQAERGMLGIATKKQMNGSTYVFLYYTEAKTKDGGEPIGNRVYRYQLINDKLVNPELLLELPAVPRPIHNGGKLIVGPDNNIYLSIGDKKTFRPQTDEMINGTSGILRITQEGDPVTSNVILGSEPPLNLYYAYGIRNSFGIDFDPLTGKLWDTENGPEYGDEVNLVEPGFNSGWEKVHGKWIEHTKDSVIEAPNTGPGDLMDFDGMARYSSPEFTFLREPGVTAIKFFNSTKLGENYENNIFVGGFHNGIIYHFDLTDDRNELFLEGGLKDKVADESDELGNITFGEGFGGITDIQVGPDGNLYVLSLYQGGNDCPADRGEGNENCISYSSDLQGTIFRIVPM